MSWRERVASIIAPRATVEAPVPSNDDLNRLLAQARDRADTLESLLNVASDPDAKLAGNQNQSLFRILSTGANSEGRDFVEAQRNKALRMAHTTYALRGVAHNIIEIFLDFTVGDGFKPVVESVEDKDLQTVLDDLWKDDRNRLQQRHEAYARSLFLEGERFMPATLSKVDGHLELGYLGPEMVKDVRKDALGRDVYLVVMPASPGAEDRLFFVLDNLNDQITIDVLDAKDDNAPKYRITETIVGAAGDATASKSVDVHGLAFAWFENRPDGATRGRSDLLDILDYIDIHDELLWTDLEISKLLRLFVLDVTDPSIVDAASAKKSAEMLGLVNPPEKPKVLLHNDKIVVQLLQGSIAKTASEKLEQIIALNIYGAKGMPEHWRGSGADTNLATASAQEMVPMKRMRRKQDRLVERFHRMLEVSIELMRRAGIGSIKDPKFKMGRTEVGGKDKARGALVLKDVVFAVSQAASDGLITKEAANAIVIQTIRDVGYEVAEEDAGVPKEDPNADLAKIQKLIGGAPMKAGGGQRPAMEGVTPFELGDRVRVKRGRAHDSMTSGKTGEIVEIGTDALGIKFEGMAEVHKWYVADELEVVVHGAP